jgi:type II secretory pathway pseudopilin PulG
MMKKQHGFILVNTLVFASIAVVITTALVSWSGSLLKNSVQLSLREQAFQIAESGIDYYRWHLAHNQTDYYDGNGASSTGPYSHAFVAKDGSVVGHYALTITPPPIGSTVVKIKSVGTVVADASVKRTIEATLAIPSFAKYAVVANDNMRFGSGTEVFGPIQSNYGIHFDGIAHNTVSSALSQYTDPDFPSSGLQFGVYTTSGSADPHPPTAVPTRSDVFMAGRQFPVPTVDFSAITTNLSQMKTDAQASGRYFSASGAQGYHIILKTNDTFDLYRIDSLRSAPGSCSNTAGQTNWGTWSINNQTLLGNYAFPANGIIFVEDHVWVDGQINTARLTIGAGSFPYSPSLQKNITVNTNLQYTNYDGTDALALIAQGNFNVGLYSDNVFRIDSAIIAQNGRVGRYYYNSSCSGGSSYHTRSTLTLYGMLATNIRYGFAYTDSTGYTTRNIIYDSNLLYSPPPSFPSVSNQYQTISWGEVK